MHDQSVLQLPLIRVVGSDLILATAIVKGSSGERHVLRLKSNTINATNYSYSFYLLFYAIFCSYQTVYSIAAYSYFKLLRSSF